MNLQPINPYQIIKTLVDELERTKAENEQLKKDIAQIKEKGGAADDPVDECSDGSDAE